MMMSPETYGEQHKDDTCLQLIKERDKFIRESESLNELFMIRKRKMNLGWRSRARTLNTKCIWSIWRSFADSWEKNTIGILNGICVIENISWTRIFGQEFCKWENARACL